LTAQLPANVQAAIKCGPVPKLRDWRSLPNDELTRAERNMRFAERYLVVPDGRYVGKPIVLAPFQEAFFYSIFDNPAVTRRAYLSKSRKNAKTATIAIILICFLVGPEARENAQICSGAMSRDQAGVVWKLASQMLSRSPELEPLVHVIPSSKKLIGLPMNVEYRALAAEGKTNHGASPLLAILDETGQVRGPHSDFVEAIETAQGAHENPLLIVISTQAATDADLLSIWLDDAERSGDPRIVSHVYTTDKDYELDDRDGWEQANPALGLFLNEQELIDGAERAKRMPSYQATFRNLHLNQRISVVNPFVSVDVWKSCGGEPDSLAGLECYAGLDLSARTDLTAFVVVGLGPNGIEHVYPFFWTPEEGIYDRSRRDRVPYDVWAQQGFLRTTPGATVDYSFVVAEIAEIVADLDLRAIGFDRWRMDIFKKELERIGIDLPMQEVGQGFKDMSPALDVLESELLNGRIRHGNHPVLTMCAANAVVTKDPANNRKLDKHKATGRIDGMVALAMAERVKSMEAAEVIDLDDMLANPLVL
jgi:phage terminase large subunit-like protein